MPEGEEGQAMSKPVKIPGTATMFYDADADALLWRSGKPVVAQKIRSGKRRRVRYEDEQGMERSSTVAALKKAAITGKPEPMLFHADKTRDMHDVRKRKYELQKASDAKLRHRLLSDEGDERHGTLRGYQLGCRCSKCRNAMRLNARKVQIRDSIKSAGRNPWTGGETCQEA